MMPGGLAMLLMIGRRKLSSHVGPKYFISFGLAVVALAMWHSTSLGPDADFNFFSWARLYQTISR